MPILVLVVVALFGVGYYSFEDCPFAAHGEQAEVVAPEARAPWARHCEATLAAAAHDFEALSPSCAHGTVEISTLPSGVDYVEYTYTDKDGDTYQVSVTEEPQNEGELTTWQGAPGCHGFDTGFETVRHDHGRLARVATTGDSSRDFARIFSVATDDCIEAQ